MKMYRLTIAALPLLFAAGAFAQSSESGIRESTDPAHVAEVERHAQELRSGQSAMGSSGQSQMQQSGSGSHEQKKHPAGKGHDHNQMHHDHPKAAPGTGK
jgi:hypothetical protein